MNGNAHRAKRTKPPATIHPIMRELRQIRIDSGTTQPDLEAHLGYSWKQISQMERGARNLYLARVEDYANYFGYEIILRKKPDETN